MAINIKDTFQVAAPIDQVWRFMTNPENLADCMPGASLSEIVDDRNFVGAVKIKIGAITAKYVGNISFAEVDEKTHFLKVLAEAKEKGGGTVNGTISTRLSALPNGQTEVQCESTSDLTGRIVQVGRGMIEGVSKQIIQKFVTNVKANLESPDVAMVTEEGVAPQKAKLPVREESINVLAVVWTMVREATIRFFRRLFRLA